MIPLFEGIRTPNANKAKRESSNKRPPAKRRKSNSGSKAGGRPKSKPKPTPKLKGTRRSKSKPKPRIQVSLKSQWIIDFMVRNALKAQKLQQKREYLTDKSIAMM